MAPTHAQSWGGVSALEPQRSSFGVKSVLPAGGLRGRHGSYRSIVCPSAPGLQTACSQIRVKNSAKSALYQLCSTQEISWEGV
jgi:hypothetical protein